jgi:hypothetical protein
MSGGLPFTRTLSKYSPGWYTRNQFQCCAIERVFATGGRAGVFDCTVDRGKDIMAFKELLSTDHGLIKSCCVELAAAQRGPDVP